MSILHSFLSFLRQSMKSHPIELLLILVFGASLIGIPDEDLFYTDNHIGGIFLFFPLFFSLTYLLRPTRFYWFSLLYIVITLGLMTFFWGFHLETYLASPAYWGVLFIHLILLLIKDFRFNNRQMIYSILMTSAHLAISFALAGIIIFMIQILLSSISYLLLSPETSIYYIEEPIHAAIFLIFTSLFFIFFEDREVQNNPEREGRLVLAGEILINFILSPVVILYTIIVYLYIAKIVALFELPKGELSFIVLSYLSLGIFCIALRHLLEKPRWTFFYRYFNYFALIPLGLVWVGIFERIQQYGFTEARVYLVAIATLISLFVLCSFSQRLLQYRLFSVLTIAMIAIVTIILSPEKIEQHSQYARFVKITTELGLLDENQKINVERLNQPFSKESDQKNLRELYSLLTLSDVKNNPEFVELYGEETLAKLASISGNSDYFEAEQQTQGYYSLYRNDDLYDNTPIDVRPYKTFTQIRGSIEYQSEKDSNNEQNLCSDNRKLVLMNQASSASNIVVEERYFKQQMTELGIDITRPLTNEQVDKIRQERDRFLNVPTTNGGLLLLNTVGFQYGENSTCRGYTLYQGDVMGYFEPKEEKR